MSLDRAGHHYTYLYVMCSRQGAWIKRAMEMIPADVASVQQLVCGFIAGTGFCAMGVIKRIGWKQDTR